MIEFSGRKGFHAWLIFKRLVAAFKVINLMKLALRELETETGMSPKVEVFPKQVVIKDLGNLIKLPWGVHQVSGKRSYFVDDNFSRLPDAGVELIRRLLAIDDATIDSILNEFPSSKTVRDGKVRTGHTSTEIVSMLSHRLNVGERRPTLVSLAGYLKFRQVPEDAAVALLLPWAEKMFSAPLSTEEVEKHIRGIYGRYGTGSLDQNQVLERIPDDLKKSIQEVWQ